jgi:hypothetical protein
MRQFAFETFVFPGTQGGDVDDGSGNSSWPSFRMVRAAAVLAQLGPARDNGLLRPIPDLPLQPNLAAMPQALM